MNLDAAGQITLNVYIVMVRSLLILFTVKISDADIANVAGSLPNWQLVAKKLGFGGEDIEDIETSHRAPADQRKAFVRKWIWKNGKAATYGKLCTALEELDEQGAAEKIREIGSER